MEFTIGATVAAPYDDTVGRVREQLAEAGFGVLTEIDIRATLHAKLGIEVAPKVILGACRPQLAHRALTADPRIAALLPCNVVVTAVDESHSLVEALDPLVMTSLVDDPELLVVAGEARERLAAMIQAVVASATTLAAAER
jgi:uncharacterized protein (DUF302 family)